MIIEVNITEEMIAETQNEPDGGRNPVSRAITAAIYKKTGIIVVTWISKREDDPFLTVEVSRYSKDNRRFILWTGELKSIPASIFYYSVYGHGPVKPWTFKLNLKQAPESSRLVPPPVAQLHLRKRDHE